MSEVLINEKKARMKRFRLFNNQMQVTEVTHVLSKVEMVSWGPWGFEPVTPRGGVCAYVFVCMHVQYV